jgi:hypothetical protein
MQPGRVKDEAVASEHDLIRTRTGKEGACRGARREDGAQAETYTASAEASDQAPRGGRTAAGHRSHLQHPQQHDFQAYNPALIHTHRLVGPPSMGAILRHMGLARAGGVVAYV